MWHIVNISQPKIMNDEHRRHILNIADIWWRYVKHRWQIVNISDIWWTFVNKIWDFGKIGDIMRIGNIWWRYVIQKWHDEHRWFILNIFLPEITYVLFPCWPFFHLNVWHMWHIVKISQPEMRCWALVLYNKQRWYIVNTSDI